MGANAFQYDVKLNLSADTKLAKTQIENLQGQLKAMSNLNLNFSGIDQLTSKVNEASDAALKLQTHLAAALNPDTGNLDFSKFNNSILKSGDSIENLSYSLLKAGSSGTKAFVSLADSISRSEIPILRTSKLVNGLYDNLKKAAGWQISSSIIHGVMGQFQQALGYAQALDKSLTDIRIVTGQSADQMARFAKEANAAAKKLSTTTVDYTDASLIYYQQGLSDAEVKKRSDITIKMANATGVSAAKVSDQLTSIWNNFDNGTKSLEYYADVMTALGAATASSTNEIAKGVQKFAAISDTVGLSYEYATSALATITATTRESADTVGNSLKTLFSRIQGLQLGDTLDDGTTLNKYSTALAKVGISIKNANGELKSMDTLLNEMGTKWSTLAEDQQMALAQTVGGARQYTQIMTLMENWDFFKENLSTAKTATGTLTQQAEIYADSWEAAQKRFKASQESLYDTLINSDSFKKILNIGSTIIEGISSALSGTNGLPGLLGTIGPILGMTFKKQLGESLSGALYNVGSLIPAVRKGIENSRRVQLNNMLHSIRDAEVTPDLGKHERDTTASIIERQYAEREQKEKYRSRMSGASEVLDVEYEKLLKDIDQQQLDLSRQRDEAELNAEYAADALRDEKYNKRNISSELTDSFGKVLVTDSQLGQDNDIAHALKLVGAREGQAETAVDQLVQKMTADKSNAYDLTTLKGDMAEIYGSLIGASDHEIAKLKSGKGEFTTDREKALKSQFDALMGDYQAMEEEMFKQLGDNPRAFASQLPDILRMTMEDYETRVLTSLGFMEDGVTVGDQSNARDIISNSARAAILKREQEKRGETRQGVVDKREALWAQSGPSLAESVVGIGSGIGATYGAIQSAYGTFNSIKDGNWGGALTGLIATGYDMASGMGDLTQSFQDLGRHGKALKNRPDIQKYNLLQQQKELQLKQGQTDELDKEIQQDAQRLADLQSKALTEKEQKELNKLERKEKDLAEKNEQDGGKRILSNQEKNRLRNLREKQDEYINTLPEQKDLELGIESLEAKKKEIGFDSETLKKVSKDLEKLDDVTAGKFSGAINKVGDGLEFVSKHADKFTIGLQAAQIAMTATAKINEYFYNEETRQAQQAATTANELANAHQTAQNNYNSLLSSIEEYNTKTNELAESNLKGAAKQAVIYDQNQAALNLIDKYNITDFKYIGDKIQISEDALEKAQEESIQAMSTAKYASGLANLSAKKEANDVIEEALERDLVYDESFQQGAGVLLAGASGAAIGATIGSVVPVIGTAIGGIVGGIAGTLVGAVNAAWADDIGERERENSFVDKAIEKTRETGSTSWMDDYAGDEFSADELKKLKENRSAIKQQAASEAAYEQAELAQRESIANDILANNDRTEKFEYADRLLDGLASEVKDWEKLGDTYGELFEFEQTRINAAKNIQSELGLSGNVIWEDNKANKMLTYTTEDGQTGTISYETLSKMEGVKKGKAESGAYIEQMMDMYEAVKADSDEATAAGVISYLSSGNFDNATFAESEAAATYLQNMLKNTDISQEDKAKALGYEDLNALKAELLTTTDFSTITGYDDYGNAIRTVTTDNINAYLDHVNSELTNELTGDNYVKDQLSTYGISDEGIYSDLYKSLTRGSGEQLNNRLSLMGEEGANEYLAALKGMLKGADPDDIDDIMTSLMALDGSDWSIDSSIIEIMDEYGITIDNTNQYLQDFVNLTREAYGAIPDLAEEMGSLISVAGSIKGLKIGDSISESTMEALKAQGYDLSDETFSTWNGESVLIGSPEELQNQVGTNIAQTYNDYMSRVNSVTSAFGKGVDYKKWLEESHLLTGTEQDFMDLVTTDDGVNITDQITKNILGDRFDQLTTDIETKKALEEKMAGYKVENGVLMKMQADGTYKPVPAGGDGTYASVEAFQNDQRQLAQASSNISIAWEAVKGAAGEAVDPTKVQEIAEQYASTFSSYEDMMGDATIQEMMENGHLSNSDALMYYASKYPELTEYVNAYNEAIASGNTELAGQIENQTKVAIAMQDSLAVYTAMTGKKADLADLNATIDSLRESMDEETAKRYKDADGNWNEEELIKLAEETMIAGVGWSNLQKHGSSWASSIGKIGDANATPAQLNEGYEAAGKMGKAMQQYLGLTEYDILGITKQDKENPIVKAINELNIDITKILNKDVAETNKLRSYLVSQSTAGQSLSKKLGITGYGTADETAANDTKAGKAYKNMKAAVGEDGTIDEEALAEANSEWAEALNSGAITWEEYSAGVEMATGGQRRALTQATAVNTTTRYVGNSQGGKEITTTQSWNVQNMGGKLMVEGSKNDDGSTNWVEYDKETHGTLYGTDGSEIDPTKTTTGGGGGGGGGGPTKVQVKSAQELMTRYKVIDQKTTINDMQKTAALQAKDLLYGQSKINQLNTINKLLQKQQQLTTDRITEELDYLEKDKKKIEELIERYNKDAKDEDKINLEFDGFGIITNYKQVIGKWAEELAAMYADGELTAEEGKKAEDLQKKIQDFNTVIKDYEDSLNQLMTSIEQYEQTLYERFSNQMEILTYKVQYKIELEQDDISYIDFYTSSIKDSYSMMYKYLELIGSKNQELLGEMAIYQQGYYDLLGYMTDDPLQLWATQGVEGILTADQVESARSYRDGMIQAYNAALATRKEIEDQVLRVFDKWNEKIEKNINGISRFTDMLSQFKDIINIVGKEAFGLSDSFMKTFEQQSINQSMNNIAASKSHYENLSKTYEESQTKLQEAQQRLEEARASGADDGVIATAEKDVEYWESIADKTQEEMESAETSMLTTLQHTLTMISEQFTNAITQAVDDFNESIYKFNGLDGLVSDYEMIREQQDLMVEDYEKIYSLNKLNRNLEKTLDNSKLTAGRAKLLEIQKEINDLNKSNVELSRYDLDYLQAKYDLKVAEMELENARNAKDTVMLSKDSEGNWSYIYSQNANVVEEAEQKVEDALFKMQQLSAQYTEEMSQAMMSISQQMRDEIAAVSIQDFESAEAYYEEIERIQAKYSEQLAHREAELNKSISNNADLYNQDWANYSEATGYKISADQEWVDSFSETTLGSLVGSTSDISDYTTLIADSTNKMNESLGAAASTYFVNADKALKTYGSSLKTFGSTVSSTTSNIITQSEKAVKEVSEMGTTLVGEFQTITETVSKDLEKWATDIGNTLTNLLDQIKNINQMIADSASKAIPETDEMIGQEEAVARLNSATFNNSSYAGWTFDGTRAIHNGVDIVAFNGQLVKDVNAALQKYADTPTTNPEAREAAAAELRKVIQDYWTFKKILEKIYDPTNIKIEEVETPDITEMSSGGYTGEWGNEGKYAVLHEKELVLNKDDTSNFLEALNVSRSLIEMIEMNARASSFGLGDMHAATIQDSLQNFEQQVTITAEFPDATDHSEIEQAFDNLINMASQYAHRYK